MSRQYKRMVPRGLTSGTVALAALQWLLFALDPGAWPGLTGAVVASALAAGNLVLTVASPRRKVGLVRVVQRSVLNPVFRTLYALGLNPLGLVLLETRGRRSGRARRVPVGNGRVGDEIWIVAEHGMRAGWVRNILADPHVRIRVRAGLRHRWVDGLAKVLPDDDPLARQRRICRWRPLRILNAAVVRALGAELVSVRVALVAGAAVAGLEADAGRVPEVVA